MNTEKMQLVEIKPDQPLPEGVVELPAALQPAARQLVDFASQHQASLKRAANKRERQNRRKGRGR